MFAFRACVLMMFICFWYNFVKATETRDLQSCETHLNKYRKFLLQAILSFEDVCDAYNTKAMTIPDSDLPPQIAFFGHYQPPEQKTEIWTFFKLFMAQFNDLEFANIVRDAVIERCHLKLQQQQMQQQQALQQQQRDEKRNTVVLGKKQRFHSWGGKRSGSGGLGNELNTDHTEDMSLPY
ncbi:leucokinin [Haematobia irritans]|uniref:leucokinin n=1 Tax=Haematobia irritans TaxID=7368 RepID=UPI003F50CEFD